MNYKSLPILIAVLAALGASAHALSAPAPADETCTLKAEIRGDGFHFLQFGRDAWEGMGGIECTARERGVQYYAVRVRYEAWGLGIGASQSTALRILIRDLQPLIVRRILGTFRTEVDPNDHRDRPQGAVAILRLVDRGGGAIAIPIYSNEVYDFQSSFRFGQITFELIGAEIEGGRSI